MAGALGNLDIELNANIANLESQFKKASQVADENMAKVAKAIAQTDKASAQTQAGLDKLIKSLNTSPGDAGLRTITKAANDSSHAMEEVGFKTAGAKRELLVLAHEMSQGNYSRFAGSMMVLGERTGAAALLFSAAGVGALALAGGVAAAAYEVYKGYESFTKMNDALKSTGNYSGQTTAQISDMAARIAGSSSDIATAKEALTGLVATGRITGDQLAAFGTAAVNMAKDNGTSVEDTVKSLATMADGGLKWMEEYNKQHHVMSAAQADLLMALDKEGKQAQVTAESLKILQDAHTRMYENAKPEMGAIATWWKDWGIIVDKVKNSLMNLGTPTTNFDKMNTLLAARAQIEANMATVAKANDADQNKRFKDLLDQNTKEIAGLRALDDAKKQSTKANETLAKGGTSELAANHFLERGTHSKAEQRDVDRQKENKDYQEVIAGLDKNTAKYEEVTKHHNDNLKNIDDNYRRSLPKDDPSKINMEASLKAQDALISQEHKMMQEREQFIARSVAGEYMTVAQGLQAKRQLIADDFAFTQAGYAKEAAEVVSRRASMNPATDKVKIAEANKQLIEIEAKRAAAAQESSKQMVLSTSEQLAIQKDFNDATKEWVRQEDLANLQQQFAIDLMGKSAVETAQLTAERKIYLDTEERIRLALKKDAETDVIGLRNAGADQVKKSNDLIQQAADIQQSGWYGSSEAIRKYGEAAANTGAQIESSMTKAFGAAENALAQFLMTGKMSFKTLMMGIESDLAHMASKSILQSILGGAGGAGGAGGGITGSLVKNFMSMLGSGTGMGATSVSALSSYGLAGAADAMLPETLPGIIADMPVIAGFLAGGGPVSSGSSYMVGEKGPEIFSPASSGTIIPNGQFGGNSGSTINHSTVINIDSRTDQAQIHQLVSKSVAQGNASLVDQLQRAGKIA